MSGVGLHYFSIAELKKRISYAENHRKKVLKHLKELEQKYETHKISYERYSKSLRTNYSGRTLHSWIKHYNSYIKDCENKIKEQEKKNF